MKRTIQLFQKSSIFILMIVVLSSNLRANKYGFDFNQDWDWQSLSAYSVNPETLENINALKENLNINEARELFLNLTHLNKPEDVLLLYEIQSIQDSLGGSFYGMAPAFTREKDTIPIPSDFDQLIATGLYLTQFRILTYQAIEQTGYPLNFSQQTLKIPSLSHTNSNIHLAFDMSCVKQTLDAFDNTSLTPNDAIEISQLKGFKEMLDHRRSLGYIPEPLPTEESLAQFILYASSKAPIQQLWKWLSPWNYFNLSDLYINKESYRDIMSTFMRFENELANLISNRMHPFVPQDFTYRDTVSFAVNWGIRSWATANTLGTNIVQFKDDYNLLLSTISHETFHRIQLELCPADERLVKEEKTFEDILSYPFEDKKDEKFYQALSYIFLEGTASYIGGINRSDNTYEIAQSGACLLNDVYQEIYVNNNLEAVDALLSQGLKSNGPFYILGYQLTDQVVLHSEKEATRTLLSNGTLDFFKTYIEIETESGIQLNKEIENKVLELSSKINN